MRKPTLASTGLVAVLSLLGWIAVSFGGETPACPEPAEPACERARLDLATAQTEAQAAADHKALWTTAVSALKAAQQAFERGDYAGATRAAQTAVEQARLGIAQTQYPLLPAPNSGGSR